MAYGYYMIAGQKKILVGWKKKFGINLNGKSQNEVGTNRMTLCEFLKERNERYKKKVVLEAFGSLVYRTKIYGTTSFIFNFYRHYWIKRRIK